MTDANTKVAAVVVTYNRKGLLLECIEHLCAQTVRPLLDVLVIDNASTDGTEEALAELIADGSITYVNTGANLGGAGGFNYGMREAVERGYDYVWVMDDDCMPEPDALEELLVHADALDGNYGWLSSKVLWKDGSICTMNVQRQNLTENITDFSGDLVPADLASFVSLFTPAKVIREFGLPIADFFLWTDDWEFTRRISRKLPCYVVPSSVVIHKSAQNMGANVVDESGERLDRFHRLYRNDVVLYRGEGLRGFAYEAVRLSGHTLRILTKAQDHKIERIASVWGGTKDGLAFHPEIEYPKSDGFDGDSSGDGGEQAGAAPADGSRGDVGLADETRADAELVGDAQLGAEQADAECSDAAQTGDPVIRILEAFAEPISFGGEESFVINTLLHMDKSGLAIDLMTPYYCDNESHRAAVATWGGSIFEYNVPFQPGASRTSVREPLDQLLCERDYDIVHIHSGSITGATNLAEVAKQHGAKVIVHAHRGSVNHNLKHRVAMMLGSRAMKESVDAYLSCSPLASTTLFPASIAKNDAVVIKNGVDLSKFVFSNETRQEVRTELGLPKDALVIGHVGRFGAEKNHAFLIDAFDLYLAEHPDARLLLVGDGELRQEIEAMVAAEQLQDHVVFVGNSDDVSRYYMAMDVFAFPSIYEGLGIVAIEAQAAGLPVIASTSVPRDIDATGNVSFVPIDDPQEWADAMPTANPHRDAATEPERIAAAGFDVNATAEQLRDIYLKL